MGISILVPGVDWSQRNLGKVTPSGSIPLQAIQINGSPSLVGNGQYLATLFPSFTTERGIVWSITSGSTYATINQQGVVTALPGALNNSVVIRATSAVRPGIFAEKTISVTSGALVYYDYLESDGQCYMLIPGGWSYGEDFPAGKIVVRHSFSTPGGYPWGSRYTLSAQAPKVGAYKQSAGAMGIVLGNGGYIGTGVTPVAGKIYRVEVTFSSSSNSSDGTASIYDDSNNSLEWSRSGLNVYLNGDISLFVYGTNQAGAGTPFSYENTELSANKFAGLEIYDFDNTKIMDLKCVTLDNIPAVIDEVTSEMYFNLGNGTLTPGNM